MYGIHDPIGAIAEALMIAKLRDLPEIPGGEYPPHMQSKAEQLGKTSIPPRRPRTEELEIWTFRETWPSTALGYGGLGGQSTTEALTIVIACRKMNTAAVYWGSGGRLGKLVPLPEAQMYLEIRRSSG